MSNSSSPLCPRCGAPLAGGSVEGLCAQCLGALNFAAETVFTADAEASAHKAPPLSPEQLAPHFPQLEILECLGRGGMGVVYKAQQKSLNRLVALKLLAPERANDAEFAKRFVREAQALAALNHPHIVTIYDFGREGGFYFLLMEFVDGVNLRQAMSAKRFTPEQALAVVPSVCEALQYAHAHGIVHRDIKPENLLLDKEGRVKIADFGVAKMLGEDGSPGLAESQPAGTPQYMAPEQKEHQRTDHRTDIYSLGVVLYEMLTGELPADKLQPPSRKVQIDVRLDEIVLRALEKKPELRYQTAVEMKTRLDDLSAPASRKVLPKSVWKKWAVLQIAGTAIVSTLAACCWHFHTARDMPVMRTGSLCMFLGLLFYSTALPMALGMMPMNATFGFRIRDSFESEERWYDVNAHFGRHLLAWCWLIIGLGAIAFFTSAPTAYASRALLLALAATLTPILLCKSWAAETSSRVPKPRLGPLRVYEILAFIGLAATSAQLLVARPQNVQPPKTAMGAVSTPASNDPRYTGLAVIGIPQPMDANSTFVAVANGTVVVDGSASVETWSPTLAPGEKPDLQKIIADTRELISHGRYEEALQRALWFHYHGLEVDPGYSAVRLSFGLANWTELARRYPKARQAMIEVRDRDTRAFAAGHGYSDLFMEVVALNKSLRDEAATQTLFKSIEQTDPALAKQCAIIVASAGKDHEAQTVGVSPTKPPELHHLQLLKRFTFDDPTISSEVVAGTDNKGIRRWLLSGSDRNILMRGLDELLKKHGEQDPEVVAQRARIEARARLVAQPRVVRLYEVANPNVEDCTVLYRAKLMAKDLEGRAYLEMWCRLPGSGEYFSRGLNQTVSGSNDWVSCETPFFLKKGEKPDLIRLNVAIDGEGEVYARDIELSTMASPNAP